MFTGSKSYQSYRGLFGLFFKISETFFSELWWTDCIVSFCYSQLTKTNLCNLYKKKFVNIKEGATQLFPENKMKKMNYSNCYESFFYTKEENQLPYERLTFPKGAHISFYAHPSEGDRDSNHREYTYEISLSYHHVVGTYEPKIILPNFNSSIPILGLWLLFVNSTLFPMIMII